MKILLAITTYNQIEYTKILINSLKEINIPNLDVMFFDDVSTDGTQKYVKDLGFTLYERNSPLGLTYGWNHAYRIFKEGNYDILILSNNDVILEQRALSNLINATINRQIICPLTTKNGAGHNAENQNVLVHYPNIGVLVDKPGNFKRTQERLKSGIKAMKKFNGFMFSMSRSIIQSEYDNMNLFDPSNVNIHQEGDLQKRLKELPHVCLDSFIFHYKGVSFPKKGIINGKDIRQNLNLYH